MGQENIKSLMWQIFMSLRSSAVEVQYHQVRVPPTHRISIFITAIGSWKTDNVQVLLSHFRGEMLQLKGRFFRMLLSGA